MTTVKFILDTIETEDLTIADMCDLLESQDSNDLSFVAIVNIVKEMRNKNSDYILVAVYWLITDSRFKTRADIKKLWELCDRVK